LGAQVGTALVQASPAPEPSNLPGGRLEYQEPQRRA